MEEICARVKKHIEAEEVIAKRREVEQEADKSCAKNGTQEGGDHPYPKAKPQRGPNGECKRNQEPILDLTPLETQIGQILQYIHHTHLLNIPKSIEVQLGTKSDKWCDYHRTKGHETIECRNLKIEIEKLIQRGHLMKYVYDRYEEKRGRARTPPCHDRKEIWRSRSYGDRRRREQNPKHELPHRGTISTIVGPPKARNQMRVQLKHLSW